MEIVISDKIELRDIQSIKPYVRNPRKNDKTVEQLCKIIPKVGFNVPIVIDEKGIIVKGHARYTAAIRLDMKKVPCIVTHADEEAIKADRIADNKISELSEWLNEELQHELDMIDFDYDFSELGLETTSFDDIPAMEDFEPEDTVSEEDRQRLYAEFLERQAKENAVEVQMTTESAIKKATAAQREVAVKPPQYYKVVCEKCGHIMFVDAKTVWSEQEGLQRV